MDYGQPFIRASVLPYALGFGAFAAILLTDGTEDLSWVRFVIATVAWGVVAFVSALLLARVLPSGTARNSPDCDRCGKPTGKPFLYNTPRTHWRCEPCEQEVTAILFADASRNLTAGLDEMFRRLGPPTDRTTEK